MQPKNRDNLLKVDCLLTIVITGVGLLATADSPRRHPPKDGILWQETLTAAAKGTRVSVPLSILKEVKANPGDCVDPSEEQTTKVDAYELRNRKLVLVSVWGRSSCFCGATGNCAFWLYRHDRSTYQQLLETEMVREFGFLQSTTNGLPDLVLWSHDSAERFPGALWKFNGHEYDSECSWEIVTSFKDAPNGIAETVERHVENNTCHQKLTPEAESFHKN